ncbi:hypothetical protein HYPSUDRAFT_46994 [Hypholoma sublateritium FD-334 SS-4]|uniref:Uncharacterized protein n=1 Tax=Hypholoma sublateritium (strain FD-334 SS-4) TaxID=945553 RepID=A0A0D2M0W0_HYPSF|nr:hypothetical protein HYPSUDRAFT_46994 [Hypholoma sublateritium FD-334 SS-4]
MLLSPEVFDSSVLPGYLSRARCTPQLREALHAFYPSGYTSWSPSGWRLYINTVKKMDFGDGGQLYLHQLKMVVRHMNKYYPEQVEYLGDEHDITRILHEMRREKVANRTPFWMRFLFRFSRLFKKQ